MFIRNHNAILLYSLTVLALFLLLRILQESRRKPVLASTGEVVLPYIPLAHHTGCHYSIQGYTFQIPSCDALLLGRPLTVFGTVEPNPDTSFLSQKRLMNVRIVQEEGKRDSVFNWFLPFINSLLLVKNRFLKSVIGYFPVAASPIGISMVFGDKTMLPASQSLLFEITGTQHLLSASGYNVGVITDAVRRILKPVPAKWQFPLLISAVWIYTLWAGLTAAVVRAAVMHTLALIAHATHRLSTPTWNLLVTVYLLVFINPWYLTDIGFQLSAAATAAIVWGTRRTHTLSTWSRWVTGQVSVTEVTTTSSVQSRWRSVKTYLTDSLRVGWWAQLGTTPLVLFHFGHTTLWSLVATTLVSWLVPFILIGTLVLGTLALSIDILSLELLSNFIRVGALGVWLGVKYFLELLSLIQRLPPLNVTVTSWPVWAVGSWWVAVYLGTRYRQIRRRR